MKALLSDPVLNQRVYPLLRSASPALLTDRRGLGSKLEERATKVTPLLEEILGRKSSISEQTLCVSLRCHTS